MFIISAMNNSLIIKNFRPDDFNLLIDLANQAVPFAEKEKWICGSSQIDPADELPMVVLQRELD